MRPRPRHATRRSAFSLGSAAFGAGGRRQELAARSRSDTDHAPRARPPVGAGRRPRRRLSACADAHRDARRHVLRRREGDATRAARAGSSSRTPRERRRAPYARGSSDHGGRCREPRVGERSKPPAPWRRRRRSLSEPACGPNRIASAASVGFASSSSSRECTATSPRRWRAVLHRDSPTSAAVKCPPSARPERRPPPAAASSSWSRHRRPRGSRAAGRAAAGGASAIELLTGLRRAEAPRWPEAPRWRWRAAAGEEIAREAEKVDLRTRSDRAARAVAAMSATEPATGRRSIDKDAGPITARSP